MLVSVEFCINVFLPLVSWSRLGLWQKWVPGIFPGGKDGQCVWLTTLSSSCAECLEILEAPTSWSPQGLSFYNITPFLQYSKINIRLHNSTRFTSLQRDLLNFAEFEVLTEVLLNHLTPNGHFSGRTAPLTYRCCIFLFIQQIYVQNILNMLHTPHFFLFKIPFIS
jgi:hypothetical protein